MAAIRAVLIAIIIIGMAVTPLVAPAFGGSSSDDATAYAAFAGGVTSRDPVLSPMADNDNDDDDNDEDNDDGDDNDNGDDDDDDDNDNSGDDNDNGGDDNDNGGDDNGNDNVTVVVHTPNESVNRPTKCFDTREVGVVQLGTGLYDVTVTVMPHSSFNQTTRLTLKSVDPASVPAPTGGSLIENTVFALDAQSSCDGAAVSPLPNSVNLGIVYNTTPSVDKSKLQIVFWNGSAWVNTDSIPDPVAGNPYISATINQPGTYALIQKS
jgi:hypothetical protein